MYYVYFSTFKMQKYNYKCIIDLHLDSLIRVPDLKIVKHRYRPDVLKDDLLWTAQCVVTKKNTAKLTRRGNLDADDSHLKP